MHPDTNWPVATKVPHAFRARISDPDRLVEAIRGADVTPCQLSHSPRTSELSRFVLPTVCLDLARMGPSMLFTGTSPQEHYTLIFVLDCPVNGYSFNFSLEHGDGWLALFPPGAVLDERTPENYGNASLTIPVARFLAAANIYCPNLPETVLECGTGLRIFPSDQSELRRLVAELNALPLGPDSPLENNACARRSLEDDLLTAFFLVLRAGWENREPRPSRQTAGRQLRLRQVRDYIASRQGEIVRIEDLCATSGLSCRGLENLFHDFLGLSPHQFLRHHRLHHVRKTLRQRPCVRPGDIKQVALDHGFWHLGRFSGYYRNLFGESPSQTGSVERTIQD